MRKKLPIESCFPTLPIPSLSSNQYREEKTRKKYQTTIFDDSLQRESQYIPQNGTRNRNPNLFPSFTISLWVKKLMIFHSPADPRRIHTSRANVQSHTRTLAQPDASVESFRKPIRSGIEDEAKRGEKKK